jgi:hypothetical protein
MRLAGSTTRVQRNLGLALVPQAGVAVGLVIVVQSEAAHAQLAGLFSAVVLTVVAVNEIVGPLLTKLALARAGELGQDRLRLIDFLQEENIVTGFRATSKQAAIESLVDLLLRSHDLHEADRAELLESVLAREAQASMGDPARRGVRGLQLLPRIRRGSLTLRPIGAQAPGSACAATGVPAISLKSASRASDQPRIRC